MTDPTRLAPGLDDAALASLNDLLAIDHDAVEAYTLAIGALTNVGRRETLMRFRGDHERHIADLGRIIRRHGGTPADAPQPASGAFQRAIAKIGAAAGDGAVVAAFRANERRVSETYARAAEWSSQLPSDAQAVLRAAADDEARHLDWVTDQLETLGVPPERRVDRVVDAAQRVRGEMADRVARASAQGRRGIDAARRRAVVIRERLPETPSQRELAVGVAAAIVAFAATMTIEATRRRR